MKAKRLQLPLIDLEWLNLIALCIGIANIALVWFCLTRIDNIVNVQLYFFGLSFSPNWSNQFTTIMILIKVLIAWSAAINVIIIAVGVNRVKSKASSQSQAGLTSSQSQKQEEKLGTTLGLQLQIAEMEEPTEIPQALPKPIKELQLQKEQFPSIMKEPQIPIRAREPKPEKAPEFPLTEDVHASNQPLPEQQPAKERTLTSQALTKTVETPKPQKESRLTMTDTSLKPAMAIEEPKSKKQILESHKQENQTLICPHCKKTIREPSVVLDLSNNKMRLVNVCPYCNFLLGTASLNEEPANRKS